MSPVLAQILGGALVAAISATGVYLVNKKKSTAETEEIAANTYRRLNQDLLLQLKDAKEQYEKDLSEARADYEERLVKKIAEKEAEFTNNLAKIKQEYELKIETITDGFESRIAGLESELDRYHTMEQNAKEIINSGAEQLKQVIAPDTK